MLVEFCFKNFKSFKQEAALDLSATKMTEFSESLILKGNEKLLPVSVLFGANASGKSTVFDAYKFMTDMVVGQFWGNEACSFTQKPFLFDSFYKEKETVFEIYFMLEDDIRDRIYNYGFSILKNQITAEWLNVKARTTKNYRIVFSRKGNNIIKSILSRNETELLEKVISDNVLIATAAKNLKIYSCSNIYDFFKKNVFASEDIGKEFLAKDLSKEFIDDKEFLSNMLDTFRTFDKTITGLRVDKNLEKKILFTHKKYDGTGSIEIPIEMESRGVRKLFSLFPKIHKVLSTGGVLFVDEIDSGFHTFLVRSFIKSVMDKSFNKNQAQFIFTTNDVCQLSNEILRRDEIWFIEKDDKGESSMFSLADIVDEFGIGIRKDESFSKNYLAGKYGAVPDMLE
ncbi:AAA family ATPase [Lachnobacterium bovis]|uniref:AAA family ATPase n=1 Tax=Lachnobacterium bovis TaxID=140626 RepID=UPI0003B6B49C|nr:ATP-binding protein [Lachnobacterium bovis]